MYRAPRWRSGNVSVAVPDGPRPPRPDAAVDTADAVRRRGRGLCAVAPAPAPSAHPHVPDPPRARPPGAPSRARRPPADPDRLDGTHGRADGGPPRRRLSRLPERLDNHLVRFDLSHRARLSPDGRTGYDWWGAGHDALEEGYFIRESPLAGAPDLDAFAWPDPWAPGLLATPPGRGRGRGEDGFVVPNLGFALFERAWSLRGFEQLLLDLAPDPAYVAELLDRITDIQLVLVERYIELGVDGGYFGDDYGAQAGLLFSPATWRRLVKPRLARLFAPFVERGLPVLMHSDGRIDEIVPDLVEIGLTALNPVQPEVLDHAWLRAPSATAWPSTAASRPRRSCPTARREVREAVADCRAGWPPTARGWSWRRPIA